MRRNIAVGDTVLYFFMGERMPPIGRPAIITSILPDDRHIGPANATPIRRVNLHVFFELADIELVMVKVGDSMGGTLENARRETCDSPLRSNVPELVTGVAPSEGPVWMFRADPDGLRGLDGPLSTILDRMRGGTT
jgi:hypothetical protein